MDPQYLVPHILLDPLPHAVSIRRGAQAFGVHKILIPSLWSLPQRHRVLVVHHDQIAGALCVVHGSATSRRAERVLRREWRRHP